MKLAKSSINARKNQLPRLKFEEQNLTSCAGLVALMPLFEKLNFKERLKRCCRHIQHSHRNLMRELQMQAQMPEHNTSHNRRALWSFEKIDTLRKTFIAKAGRLSRPQGKLTLSMNANAMVESLITKYIHI